MSIYTKATSFVLDSLWSKPHFREFFIDHVNDRASLEALNSAVFEPAYLTFKDMLDEYTLDVLESQVMSEMMSSLNKQQGFKDVWAVWDEQSRDLFIGEQAELALAKLMFQVYHQRLDTAFRMAYIIYMAAEGTKPMN